MKKKFRFLLFLTIFVLIFTLVSCKKKEKKVIVSFDSCGGSAVSSIEVKKDDKIGTLPETSKDGYTFIGWFLEVGDSKQVFEDFVVEKDLTLYAHYNKNKEMMSVNFETNGGSTVSKMEVEKGNPLGKLPFTEKLGFIFTGWFLDEALTIPFYDNDIINKNLTVYAGFEKLEIETVLPEYTETTIEVTDTYYIFKLTSLEEINELNINDFIEVITYYGKTLNFKVVRKDNLYLISPIGGYSIGGVYQINLISDDVKFTDLNIQYENDSLSDDCIKTLNITCTKDVLEVTYKDGIIEIENDSILLGVDSFTINNELLKDVTLEIATIIYLKDEERYVKVREIELGEIDAIIYFEDCDPSDVYDDFLVNSSDTIADNILLSDENKDETTRRLKQITDSLYDSEGTMAITQMLANALNSSETLKKYARRNSNSYQDRITDKTGLNITVKGLLEDLEITATIGFAKNPNFNGISIPKYNEDLWTMLALTFSYEGTLKNKVKLEASITITQYIYVWFSGSADSTSGDFKVEATPFSQTDIEFKVLICSTSEDGDDDKEEEKKDISVEISKLVEGEGDSSNIIEEVQEMLDKKGDAIELCKAPLFSASYVIGGILSINFDLNFVIKVSFAAGIKIEATLLEATTVGVRGNYKNKTIDTYKRQAKGSDRYILDIYAYGYLGLKAGIEGELSVSFVGLKSVLRAGVAVEVGAYADLYGYLHYHAEERRVYKDIDTSGRHYQTLSGGIYFEMGIYVELKAFLVVGKKEFSKGIEFKFKLLEVGDEYLYIEPLDNDGQRIIFYENDEGELEIDGIIPSNGKFLNIKTGEVTERTMPVKNLKILSNTNLFRIDNANHKIIANKEKLDQWPDGIVSGFISLYYKGPNILFSSKQIDDSISELAGYRELARIEVFYVRRGVEISEENIGKESTITYVVDDDITKTTVKTIKVLSGSYFEGGVPKEVEEYLLNNSLIRDLNDNFTSFDGPLTYRTMATGDATYTFKTTKALRFIGYLYMSDLENKTYTFEVMAISYNDLPKLEDRHLKAKANNAVELWVMLPDGTEHVMSNKEYLSKYDLYMRGTSGYDTNVVLKSTSGTLEDIENIINQMYKGIGEFEEYSEFFTYTVLSKYLTGIHFVTITDIFDRSITENVPYGEKFAVPTYIINNINNKGGMKLVGWDTNGDGEVDILPDEEFEVISDMKLTPILSSDSYTITIKDLDGTILTYNVNAYERIPDEVLNIINNLKEDKRTAPDGSYFDDSYWQIISSTFIIGNEYPYFGGISSEYLGDLEIMPTSDLTFTYILGDLYHLITFTDNFGGHFVDNTTGKKSTSIVYHVKDGGSVLTCKEYGKYTYVKPADTSTTIFVSSSLVDKTGSLFDISSVIHESGEYLISWFTKAVTTYHVKLEVCFYDEWGEKYDTKEMRLYEYLSYEKYEELKVSCKNDYNYYMSDEYLNSLEDDDYTYINYTSAQLNVISEYKDEKTGKITMYYRVCIKRQVKNIYTEYNSALYINDETFMMI